jgi:hypothetical protein
VLNSLSSPSGQRTYVHAIREFVAWYSATASFTVADGFTEGARLTVGKRFRFGGTRKKGAGVRDIPYILNWSRPGAFCR